MRILFIGPNRVGDAVLSTGLIDHLRQQHPDARFWIACGRPAEGVFARLPGRVATRVIDKRRLDLHWLGLWAWAVRRRWDLVVDIRGSALGYMVRARRRAVMRSGVGPKIAQLAAVLRLDPPPAPVAWIAPADRARAAALLPAGRPLVMLGPTANWPPKVWPAAHFAALFQALASGPLPRGGPGGLPGAVPVVLGGAGAMERALAEPLLRLLPGAVDLCGLVSLPEAAACLERAALFVGNDSGLMHLAAAAGAPTLGLFGPTDPAVYAPVGRWARAIAAGSDRMEALTPDTVLDSARDLLAGCAGR